MAPDAGYFLATGGKQSLTARGKGGSVGERISAALKAAGGYPSLFSSPSPDHQTLTVSERKQYASGH
jgi:hypothetical protein